MSNSPRASVESTANVAEWAALTTGTALADLSSMGRLRITGADALDLLNRLTTNKLESLAGGTARSTVVTNGNGRVIDLVHLAAPPGHLVCLTSPGRAQTIIDWLDTYTFGEDITVVDRSTETVQFALAGPLAPRTLEAAGAVDLPRERDHVTGVRIGGVQTVIWRALPGGADGFHIITEASHGDAVRASLLDASASPVSEPAWDAFRIANGFPVFGAEFDESTNPLESRLRGAISEDKGCYTGQEVIARLLTYRKVQRRLMAVELSGAAAPGAELTVDRDRAGVLTSRAVLPDGRVIGLGLLSAKLAMAGSEVRVSGAEVTGVLHEPAYALATEPPED